MSDEMEEIIAEFVIEAEESLDKIDPLFVEIETKGHDKEILNEIFRSMHTIKGAAGFLGFKAIVDVAHCSESILKRIREGEISLTRRITDVILKSMDMLRLLLNHLKLKDGKEEDVSSLLQELEGALNNEQLTDAAYEIQGIDSHDKDNATFCYSSSFQPNPPFPSFDKKEEQGRVTAQAPISEDQSVSHSSPEKEPEEFVRGKKEYVQNLRVETGKIDKVMDLTGEVVLVRNRLLNIVNYLEMKYSDDPYIQNLFETVSFLDLGTSDMQLAVMRIRMQPIKKVFGKFPRLVRDISSSIGKDVILKICGENTEVDKSVIEHVGDPLVHIIRNAIDHGIEPIEERVLKGKPKTSAIEINAYQKGNQIVIEVIDDGRGIDVDLVKRKAIKKSLITGDEALRMTESEATNLIFVPGFSTVEIATELSGRGVGMDVVKTNISKLNGYIEVITKKDVGSTFRISIPLTLAIIQVLMIRSGISHYAIPLTPIEETLKVSKKEITAVAGQKFINIRGRVIPIFELSDILGNGNHIDSEQRYVVVVSIGETKFCIAMDELLGQEEIVIKNIEGLQIESSCTLGATITGDGKVVLILDPAGILRNKLTLMRT